MVPPPAELCVQVDVGGDRAGHLDCAAEALQRAARLAQSQARAAFDAAKAATGMMDETFAHIRYTSPDRHNDGANYLFCDSHVKFLVPTQVKCADAQCFWSMNG